MSRVAGVDIGGTKILGVALDRTGPPVPRSEHRVPTHTGATAVLDAVESVVDRLRHDAAADGTSIDALGLGVAGLVNRDGVLHVAPHLPSFRDTPIRATLEKRLGIPVVVDNDATCTAWGEHQAGAARGEADSLCVALGTGIGAGIVADGTVLRGAHGFAGEAGHMVLDPNGPICPCGRRGCWERLASGTGLGRMARDAADAGQLDRALKLAGGDGAALRGEHVSRAAHEGDEQALELLRSFAWWVALGLGNLVTLLDPKVVVIGGGLIEIGDPLVGPIKDHYHQLVMADDARSDVRIVAAELGERAGAIGAALLAP